MTPEQTADFLAKINTVEGEKQIAESLSFEVLMGEIFKRLNGTDKTEADRVADLIRKSDVQCKRMELPGWVKQNITLYHSLFVKFLTNKSHANQHAAPVKKDVDPVAIKISGTPPESAGQPEDIPSPG